MGRWAQQRKRGSDRANTLTLLPPIVPENWSLTVTDFLIIDVAVGPSTGPGYWQYRAQTNESPGWTYGPMDGPPEGDETTGPWSPTAIVEFQVAWTDGDIVLSEWSASKFLSPV